MFFVGATGQLITLILTVCLPFVFMVSGHQKINSESSLILSELSSQPQKTILLSFDSQKQKTTVVTVLQEIKNKITFLNSPPLKFPVQKFLFFKETICLNNSGNKAPPSKFKFYC